MRVKEEVEEAKAAREAEPKAKSKVMPVVVFALFGAAGLMGVVFAAAVKILRSDIAGNNACTPHSGTYQQASQVLTATIAAPASYVSSTTSTSGTSISLNYVKKNGFQGMALGIMIDVPLSPHPPPAPAPSPVRHALLLALGIALVPAVAPPDLVRSRPRPRPCPRRA